MTTYTTHAINQRSEASEAVQVSSLDVTKSGLSEITIWARNIKCGSDRGHLTVDWGDYAGAPLWSSDVCSPSQTVATNSFKIGHQYLLSGAHTIKVSVMGGQLQQEIVLTTPPPAPTNVNIIRAEDSLYLDWQNGPTQSGSIMTQAIWFTSPETFDQYIGHYPNTRTGLNYFGCQSGLGKDEVRVDESDCLVFAKETSRLFVPLDKNSQKPHYIYLRNFLRDQDVYSGWVRYVSLPTDIPESIYVDGGSINIPQQFSDQPLSKMKVLLSAKKRRS